MTTYTQDQLLDKYENLPENLKGALFSVNNAKVMQDIGKQNNLTVAQVGALAEEAGFIILGISPTKDFISRLSENLKIDKEKAREIAHQINDKIFSKVRESLKEIHGMKPSSTKTAESKEELPRRTETLGKIPNIIEPQKVLEEEETSLENLANEMGGVAHPKAQRMEQIAQTLEKNPEVYGRPSLEKKLDEIPTPALEKDKTDSHPLPKEDSGEKTSSPQPPDSSQDSGQIAKATEGGDIFSEKMKEEGHRLAPETTEKEYEPFFDSDTAQKKEEKKDKVDKPQYKKTTDPYREPIE